MILIKKKFDEWCKIEICNTLDVANSYLDSRSLPFKPKFEEFI